MQEDGDPGCVGLTSSGTRQKMGTLLKRSQHGQPHRRGGGSAKTQREGSGGCEPGTGLAAEVSPESNGGGANREDVETPSFSEL